MAELYQIFVHVACGRGSVLLLWYCDTLRASGFMDDIMFSYYGGSCWNQAQHYIYIFCCFITNFGIFNSTFSGNLKRVNDDFHFQNE